MSTKKTEPKKKEKLLGIDTVKAAIKKAHENVDPMKQMKVEMYWPMMLNRIKSWKFIGPENAPTGVSVVLNNDNTEILQWK
jgi:hypothetical protein